MLFLCVKILNTLYRNKPINGLTFVAFSKRICWHIATFAQVWKPLLGKAIYILIKFFSQLVQNLHTLHKNKIIKYIICIFIYLDYRYQIQPKHIYSHTRTHSHTHSRESKSWFVVSIGNRQKWTRTTSEHLGYIAAGKADIRWTLKK